MSQNYQRIFEETLRSLAGLENPPRLLLHCCCAPCSTAVLDILDAHLQITLLYYNPNIYPEEEYLKRGGELKRLTDMMEFRHPVSVITAAYKPEAFEERAAGLENEPEGGRRCLECFALRLEETAKLAAEGGFDYFTTTLSVSPHKNAEAINTIGAALAERYNISYLYADFKKKDGYKRSVRLSGAYGIYRQNYCGCRYSLRDRHKGTP